MEVAALLLEMFFGEIHKLSQESNPNHILLFEEGPIPQAQVCHF